MLKGIVLFLSLTLSIFAIEEANIQKVLETKIDMTLETLKKDKTNIQKILVELEPLFDFETMAKISLGKNYNNYNKEEIDTYIKAFSLKMKNDLVSKLSLYSNEIVTYQKLIKPKENRIVVNSKIVNDKKEEYTMDFKWFKNDKNEWYIYDIELLGVSVLQTMKVQVEEILQKDKDIKKLIERITSK